MTATVDKNSSAPNPEPPKAFDKLADKGAEGGLFQKSIQAIREDHTRSIRFRAVLVVAGLFTDRSVYQEVLACFYKVTHVLEDKLVQLQAKNDKIAGTILQMGYRFGPAYAEDLQFLYGKDRWEAAVQAAVQSNPAVETYCAKIESMTTGAQLAGAVFCLWGALILGGGAAVEPKIQRRYGAEATHLFRVVSDRPESKAERKRAFVALWDGLAAPGTTDFETVVSTAKDCMLGNNNVLGSIRRNPWWMPRSAVLYGMIPLAVVALGWWYQTTSPNGRSDAIKE